MTSKKPLTLLVVHVADEERLGGERVGLHVHVSLGHGIHKRGLPHVRETRQ